MVGIHVFRCAGAVTLDRRRLCGIGCGRNGASLLADTSVSNADNYRRALPTVWHDPVSAVIVSFRYFRSTPVSAVWCCSMCRRRSDPGVVGVSKIARVEINTRSCSCHCRTLCRVVDLEYRVESDVCVSGDCEWFRKRQTPRRTGAFVRQRGVNQAATAPCDSHSSLVAFCTRTTQTIQPTKGSRTQSP